MRLEIERCTKLLNNSNATDSEASQSAVGKLSPPQLMQKVKEAEQQKQFLLSLIHAKPGSGVASLRNAHLNLSYESACLIASYLASERPFMKSFDVYLRQVNNNRKIDRTSGYFIAALKFLIYEIANIALK